MYVADGGEANFSLKVMMNEKKTKVLFAEADSAFVDTLLSFLTLPLGRIIKVLDKKYGDEAPTIGSLSTLHRSLANLDSSHFVTEGAKETLLDPISIFDAEYERLKLGISDSTPAEYFCCTKSTLHRFRSVSMYYDTTSYCDSCSAYNMITEVVEKRSEAASNDGVFTTRTTPFIISDDLQILSSKTGFLQVISTLCITDMDNTEAIKVDFALSEIMYLLKASLTSPTPLSDLILNKTGRMNSVVMVESQSVPAEEGNPSCSSLTLKVMIRKSTV